MMQIESDFEKKFPIKNNSLSIIKNPKFLPNAKLPINEWVIFDQVSLFNILQKMWILTVLLAYQRRISFSNTTRPSMLIF